MTDEQTATAPGRVPSRRAARVQTIDFTRPTKFTADHERRLHRALVAFCRTSSTRLSAELRLPVELDVLEATQLTWASAHNRLSSSALCGIVELQPLGTRMLLSADAGLALTGIESLLGGVPDDPPQERRLTEIDLALARRLFEGLLAQLAVVWRDFTGLDLELAGLDTQMETAQVAAVSEPTLSLSMEARLRRASYALTLLVPHCAIAPVEDRILGRHDRGAEASSPAARHRLREALSNVELALCAEIAGVEMPAERVLLLAPGETLPLGVPVAAGLGLCIAGVPVLRGAPGRSGRRRAVQITDPVEAGGVAGPTAPSGTSACLAPAPSLPRGEDGRALGRSLSEVPVRIWAELGRARMPAGAVVELPAGAVVELNRRVDDPIDLYVNGLPFASGRLRVGEDSEWAMRIDAVSGLESGVQPPPGSATATGGPRRDSGSR